MRTHVAKSSSSNAMSRSVFSLLRIVDPDLFSVYADFRRASTADSGMVFGRNVINICIAEMIKELFEIGHISLYSAGLLNGRGEV